MKKHAGSSGYLDTAITLSLSLVIGFALLTGTKGVIKNTEGKTLAHQLSNELTTQVTDCNFEKWEMGGNLVKPYPDSNEMIVRIGEVKKISYYLVGADTQNCNIVFSSSDTKIVTVSNTGDVTGVSAGVADVYLQTNSGVRTKVSVTVKP